MSPEPNDYFVFRVSAEELDSNRGSNDTYQSFSNDNYLNMYWKWAPTKTSVFDPIVISERPLESSQNPESSGNLIETSTIKIYRNENIKEGRLTLLLPSLKLETLSLDKKDFNGIVVKLWVE